MTRGPGRRNAEFHSVWVSSARRPLLVVWCAPPGKTDDSGIAVVRYRDGNPPEVRGAWRHIVAWRAGAGCHDQRAPVRTAERAGVRRFRRLQHIGEFAAGQDTYHLPAAGIGKPDGTLGVHRAAIR